MAWINPVENNWVAPSRPAWGGVVLNRYIICGGGHGGADMPTDGWVVLDTDTGTSKAFDGAAPLDFLGTYTSTSSSGVYRYNGSVISRYNIDGTIDYWVVSNPGYVGIVVSGTKAYLWRPNDSVTSNPIKIFDFATGTQASMAAGITGDLSGLVAYDGDIIALSSSTLYRLDSSDCSVIAFKPTGLIGYRSRGNLTVGPTGIAAIPLASLTSRYLQILDLNTLTGLLHQSKLNTPDFSQPAIFGSTTIICQQYSGERTIEAITPDGAITTLIPPTARDYGQVAFVANNKLWVPSGEPLT